MELSFKFNQENVRKITLSFLFFNFCNVDTDPIEV